MKQTFGHHLYQFALSIDIVEETTFNEVIEEVKTYVNEKLHAQFFELLISCFVDEKNQQEGLRSTKAWVLGGRDGPVPLRGPDNRLKGHSAYAYVYQTPLWIVTGNRQPFPNKPPAAPRGKTGLREDTPIFRDLWSNTDPNDLPAYLSFNKYDIRTSILVPVRDQYRTLGVINLETTEYREPTDIAKEELVRIADALAVLYQLLNSYLLQKRSTQTALRQLRDFRSASQDNLTKPTIFIASSDRADEEVMGLILKVLDEFEDRVTRKYWKEISESGDINQQLLREIGNCTFAICYFSEPFQGETAFSDNNNVVFEAGMLHALTNHIGAEPRKWIPIREKDSAKAPFDFVAQRMVVVNRKKDGSLNAEHFTAKLRQRLAELFNP